MTALAATMELPGQLAARRPTFAECYEAYRHEVFRVARRYGGGSEAFADDVAHDVFIKLLDHLSEVVDVPAWLYRVTANLAISRLRSERWRRARLRLAFWHPEPAEPSPEDDVAHGEVASKALRALRTLPARERVVVCMKVLDGKSQREIAEALSLSEGYVSKLLARARQMIDPEAEVEHAQVG